jgi:hypothetical protein
MEDVGLLTILSGIIVVVWILREVRRGGVTEFIWKALSTRAS